MIGRMLVRNLRHHLRLLLVLCLGLCLFEMFVVWIASRIDTGPGLITLIEMFVPPEMRGLFSSQLGMATFAGAVAFGFQHPFVLTIFVALAVLVGTIPAGERETGYLDLVLARPVPRSRYLAAVILQLGFGAIVLPLAVLGGAIFGLQTVEVPSELPWVGYIPSAIAVSGLMLAISGYTLLIAAGSRRRGTAVAHAAGWTLGFFIIDTLGIMWAPLRSVSWISPFRYCRPMDAAVLEGSQASNLAVLLVVFLATTLAALWRFQRQDL